MLGYVLVKEVFWQNILYITLLIFVGDLLD